MNKRMHEIEDEYPFEEERRTCPVCGKVIVIRLNAE